MTVRYWNDCKGWRPVLEPDSDDVDAVVEKYTKTGGI